MAIDFSQVKSITIPEGDVKSISVGGVVIWQAAPELTSITLAGYNTSLYANSSFLYGGTVTANYSDGTTADVTLDTTFSGYNMSTVGTQTVTASYTEGGITKTATYELTIVAAPSWHTIWSGSKSSTSSNFASTAAGTGTTPQIRVTFNNLNVSNSQPSGTKYYYLNGSTTSTKPTSPQTITLTSTNNMYVIGSYAATSYESAYARLKKTNGTNNVTFSLEVAHNDPTYFGQCSASITVTKIEQYY